MAAVEHSFQGTLHHGVASSFRRSFALELLHRGLDDGLEFAHRTGEI